MEATQTTIPGTEAHTTANGHATEEKTKQGNPGYIALVTYFPGPEDTKTDLFAETPVEFIEAKTRTELAKKLADPKVNRILGVIRGRHVQFSTARKITF